MYEEELLLLFESVNIHIGKLNPCVVKAWFDTDCYDILTWICSSINEDCYMSAQQDFEYKELDKFLTQNQLKKTLKDIEMGYPDMFEFDTNILKNKMTKIIINILEEQLKDYNHEICINQELNDTLLQEVSNILEEETHAQLEQEIAQEKCRKLGQELDILNYQIHDQVMKYSQYLNNYYESAEFPEFANNMDITQFEESLCSLLKNESDLCEMSTVKHVTDTLSEVESRIFQSYLSYFVLQMEIEAMNSTLFFFENYNVNCLISFIDQEFLLMSVGTSKDQQAWMLKVVEEISGKLAEQRINHPILRCLKNEISFFQLKLNCLNKFKESLVKIIVHFIIIHDLYLQEKNDISSSSQFFRCVGKYINKNFVEVNNRKVSMQKIISHYEDYRIMPMENKLLLVHDFGTFPFEKSNTTMREMLQWSTAMKNNLERQKRQIVSIIIEPALKKLRNNVQEHHNFLICGPSCQIVIVPINLQMLVFKVNQHLVGQNSSIKLLIQVAQRPKDCLYQDKWLSYRNQLWIHFMTDGSKVVPFLEQIEIKENTLKGQNI